MTCSNIQSRFKLEEFIVRAGRIVQKSDFYNTFVCVSPVVFDALIRDNSELEVWRRSERRDGIDYRSTLLPKHNLEVWAMTEIGSHCASVCVHGCEVWSGHLYQSNHERLIFMSLLDAHST
jgi:hypothetical protein